ncbi:carboxymuconolactone decarboxylase family protein [Paludibaculum fermentans]|uniref:carboxymuconolactone decarboxylase family protein n=1 Tax=Paludibaculum fermentans TaxID=1473598 RepID=UPI003EBFAE94
MEQERPGLQGEAFVTSLLQDLETSQLDDKEKELFRFVDKVNHQSPQMTAADMAPLLAVGYDDEAIYYAITVCALFNFYNRWIDASGVHALSDEAHRMGGKRSAGMGYVRK